MNEHDQDHILHESGGLPVSIRGVVCALLVGVCGSDCHGTVLPSRHYPAA